MNEEIKVVYYSVPLSVKMEDLESILLDSDLLNKAIIHYREELKEENIETWITKKNMIVTENGYKIALDEKSAEILESKKSN